MGIKSALKKCIKGGLFVNPFFIAKVAARFEVFLKERNIDPREVVAEVKGKPNSKSFLVSVYKRGLAPRVFLEREVDLNETGVVRRLNYLLAGLAEIGVVVNKSATKVGYSIKHRKAHKESAVIPQKDLIKFKTKLNELREKYKEKYLSPFQG